MSGDERRRAKEWKLVSAAFEEAARLNQSPAEKAALFTARLRAAGLSLGPFENCEVCGAMTQLPEQHARWHERGRT